MLSPAIVYSSFLVSLSSLTLVTLVPSLNTLIVYGPPAVIIKLDASSLVVPSVICPLENKTYCSTPGFLKRNIPCTILPHISSSGLPVPVLGGVHDHILRLPRLNPLIFIFSFSVEILPSAQCPEILPRI